MEFIEYLMNPDVIEAMGFGPEKFGVAEEIFKKLLTSEKKPKPHWTLEKVDIETTPKRMKDKLNIRQGDPIYKLCLDGVPVSHEFFRSNMYSTKDLDKERYLILVHLIPKEYSESTVKYCDLKSPWHLDGMDCIVDKETGEIIFECEDLDTHIYRYNNIIKAKGNRYKTSFFNLLTRKPIVVIEDSNEIWEARNSLYIKTPKYSKAENIFRLDTITGEFQILEGSLDQSDPNQLKINFNE